MNVYALHDAPLLNVAEDRHITHIRRKLTLTELHGIYRERHAKDVRRGKGLTSGLSPLFPRTATALYS